MTDTQRPDDQLVAVVAELRDEVRRLRQRVDLAPTPDPAADNHPPAALPAWRRPTRGEQRGEVTVAVGLMIALQLALPGASPRAVNVPRQPT